MKELEKNIDYLITSKVKVDKKILYEALNKTYNDNFNIVKKIETYLQFFETEHDSVLFSFITLSYLKNQGFDSAFTILTKCCSQGIQPLANVLIGLYGNLLEETSLNSAQMQEYKNFLDVQVKLFYTNENYNSTFKRLSEEFNRNNEYLKTEERRQKSKKRKLPEMLFSDKLFKQPEAESGVRHTKKEPYHNMTQEYSENDKDPSKY